MSKTIEQVVQIIDSGGGVILDAKGRGTERLVEVAAAAVRSDVKVILRNAGAKTTDQLVEIATAGKGRVVFEL